MSKLNPTTEYGSLVAGMVFSAVLYGVTCCQTFFYWVTYKGRDRAPFKLLVGLVWALDTLNLVLTCVGVWNYIFHPGEGNKPITANTLVSTIVGTIVQAFFLWRIWILRNSAAVLQKFWVIPLILLPAVVTELGLGIFFMIREMLPDLPSSNFAGINEVVAETGNGIALGVDAAITISMVFLLYKARTGYVEGTDQILVRLIVWSITTGFWTALFLAIVVALNASAGDSFVESAFYLPVCKLYVNMLLGTLNARNYVRDGLWVKAETERISLSNLFSRADGNLPQRYPPQTADGTYGISIERTTQLETDSLESEASQKKASKV